VRAELGAVVRLLLTTPSVAEFVELINDGCDIRDLGRSLGIERVVRNEKRGDPAMSCLDDNDVIIHNRTGIFSISQLANEVMPPKSSRVLLAAGSSKLNPVGRRKTSTLRVTYHRGPW
jgi:hypothetical protein